MDAGSRCEHVRTARAIACMLGLVGAFQPLVPDQLPRYPRPDELVGILRSFGSVLLPSTDFVDACEPYSPCNDRSLEMQLLRSGLSPTL